VGGEEATGRPADGAGTHPKGWNEEEVSAATRVAARRGGPKGKRRPPHRGSETTQQRDRAGAALARSPQHWI